MRPLLAAAALAALTVASPAAAKTWDQAFKVGSTPSLSVITNDAHVRLHVGAANAIQAHVVHDLKKWGLYIHETPTEVSLVQTGNRVEIIARTHGLGVVFGGVSEKFFVDVTVPANCAVDVRSSDGAVDVPEISGHVQIETSDGHIRVTGARGDITLFSGDGGIDAEGLDGSLHAHTTDGHLHVSGRFDHLDLRTGDGRMEALARRGSKLADDWSLETRDGGLQLHIPHDLRALLDARTGDGRLHVDLPIAVRGDIRHHTLTGELNGGGPRLRLRSGDGSMTLGLSD